MAKKTSANVGAAIEVLPPADQEEIRLVQETGSAITGWVAGLLEFFKEAMRLEKHAEAQLAAARTLKAPTTGAEDEVVQQFIKRVNGGKKVVEEHWKITSVIDRFHKRLTARRKRSMDALDEAARIGNGHHNAYVQAAERKAREEQARLELEADERAEKERKDLLDSIEAQAVQAEQANELLSEREQQFCAAYHMGADAVNAAKRAGYRDPAAQATRLLKSSKILEALEGLRKAAERRSQAAAIKAEPLMVDPPPVVRPDVVKASGSYTRTYRSAALTDEKALILAAVAGQVPLDILQVNQAALNDHARRMGALINAWPGCRLVEETKVV